MTKRHEHRGRPRVRTPELIALARKLRHEQFLPIPAIAARLGCSERTVNRMLRKEEEC